MNRTATYTLACLCLVLVTLPTWGQAAPRPLADGLQTAPLQPIVQAAPGLQPAVIVVRVPADAVVDVEGVRTKSTGEVRRFTSPPLASGRSYIYRLKATWTEQGKEVVRER